MRHAPRRQVAFHRLQNLAGKLRAQLIVAVAREPRAQTLLRLTAAEVIAQQPLNGLRHQRRGTAVAYRTRNRSVLADRSAELGAWLLYELRKLRHPHIKAIRGRGLLIGIELLVPARSYCEKLKELGLLCKETHDYVIRLAPPLIISEEDLAWAVGQVRKAFEK